MLDALSTVRFTLYRPDRDRLSLHQSILHRWAPHTAACDARDSHPRVLL